jgi:hypothetical protein
MEETKIRDNGRPYVPKEELLRGAFAPLLSANPCMATDFLTAPYNEDNGQDGIMFDVIAAKNITVTCFEDNFEAGTWDIEIWAKAGTCVGFQNTPGAWTLLGTALNVVSSGLDLPTYIPISVNYSILAGQTAAFYITETTNAGATAYTDGAALPGVPFISNTDITITEGYGKEYPFATNYSPRQFNGTVYYNINSYTPDESLVIVNQSLNAELASAPSYDNTPHIIVWNLVKNSLQWVNTLTNYVDKELFGNDFANLYITTSVAALVQADLSLPPYIDMPVGAFISITDYSASGKGGTFQKISIAGGDQTDWVVFSTEDRLVTGGTGTTPIV